MFAKVQDFAGNHDAAELVQAVKLRENFVLFQHKGKPVAVESPRKALLRHWRDIFQRS